MNKILLIEDDVLLKEVIKELLIENEYKVFAASTGEEGLLLTNEVMPDLIICDIMMPGMDGYEVKSTLNKNPSEASIPFIFLTAKAEMTDFRAGMELGAEDYLVKPFEAETLLHTVKLRLQKTKELKLLKSIDAHSAPEKNCLSNEETYLISVNNKSRLIKINDIVFIHAMREYSELCLNDNCRVLIRRSLKSWEKRLPPESFIRIYRNTIVNINYIVKLEKKTKKSYALVLENIGHEFIISRRYAAGLKDFFKIWKIQTLPE